MGSIEFYYASLPAGMQVVVGHKTSRSCPPSKVDWSTSVIFCGLLRDYDAQ